MAHEADETDPADHFPTGEDEDVLHIKQEWEKLHRESAEEHRKQIQAEVERQKATWESSVDDMVKEDIKRQPPPARLPSLGSMEGRVPATDGSPAFGKKLPGLGSLGHRLGIMVSAGELEPEALTVDKKQYYFGIDTPTQTEIRWSPPSNAEKFSAITYNIEVDMGQGWTPVNDSRQPLFRVYFTSEKIIVGRFQRVQEIEPVAVRIHVRATGTVKVEGREENISGPWSDDIWLTIEGKCITENTAV